jgi:hypothetical protein
MKKYTKLLKRKNVLKKKPLFMDNRLLYLKNQENIKRSKDRKMKLEVKNFLTLQENNKKKENKENQRKLNRIISQKSDVTDIFEVIYKNRFNNKNLKKDIMKLIKIKCDPIDINTKLKTPIKSQSISSLKNMQVNQSKKRCKQEEKLSNALKEIKKNQRKKLKIIHLRASSEKINSITSIDSSIRKRKFLFQGLRPKNNQKSPLKKKVKINVKSTRSVDREFAKKLIKQSFLKINKDMLNQKIKNNNMISNKKKSSHNLMLNEIFQKRYDFSLFDSFTDYSNKDEILNSFVKKLKEIFYSKGYRSESNEKLTKKKNLQTLIQNNLYLFKNGIVLLSNNSNN